MKAVFQEAIDQNNSAAFLAAAEIHGVRPSAVLPYARRKGVEVSKDTSQVFICELSQIDSTPDGVHDGIRGGSSSRITKKAESLCFSVADLAKVLPHEVRHAALIYRTSCDSWVFESATGARTDPVTWAELAPVAEAARYQAGWDSGYIQWLQNLELEDLPA